MEIGDSIKFGHYNGEIINKVGTVYTIIYEDYDSIEVNSRILRQQRQADVTENQIRKAPLTRVVLFEKFKLNINQ